VLHFYRCIYFPPVHNIFHSSSFIQLTMQN